MSVKEIMDSCTVQIGPVGYDNTARKDLERLSAVKSEIDEAMDRLLLLYEEYCDQNFATQKPVNFKEANDKSLGEFLEKLDSRKKKKRIFEDKDVAGVEKSVDVIMREELHNECLLERCFDDPLSIKNAF